MKTLLILSFYFPPHYGVKVVRTIKFCKLLPAEGWKPWVLTVDPSYYNGKTLNHYMEDIKDTNISRIPYVLFPGNAIFIKLIYSFIAAGFAIWHRKKIDAIYISGSPFYPFPLTVLLTGLFKIPSVLDFRDSWSFNYGYDGRAAKGAKNAIRSFVYGNIERIAIRYASKVIFSTSVLQDEYTSIIPKYRYKYLTVTNGIDLDDFSNIEPNRISEHKTIIMAGKFNLYTSDAMLKFLKCLKTMPGIHFLYVGEENKIVLNAAETHEVQSQVTAMPFQPYYKVLQLIAGADAAMLSNGLANGMGTKIFDYLALNKPTLCLVPEKSIISRQFGHYEPVIISEAPHTYDKIKQGMEKVFAIEGCPSVPLNTFTRQAATRQLSLVLRQIS